MRSVAYLLLAATVAWSSVQDNAALCADSAAGVELASDAPCSGDRDTAPHACLSCPCRLPTTEAPQAPGVGPEQVIVARLPAFTIASVHSADIPAPPTPPPNRLA